MGWSRRHGARSFPWRDDADDPYRVWVSEVMLQQTGTATVLRYYPQFIRRFPDAAHLARASVDEVLHLWSGLGYYARARALHAAAGLLLEQHDGKLPTDIAMLQQLPGVGRSTAAAILAISHGRRHAILDGNVKRVLCRYHGIREWPDRAAVKRRLWELAEYHTPHRRVADYTQAIMDLGATVCVRGRPKCACCPLSRHCLAHATGDAAALPVSRTTPPIRLRQTRFIILLSGNDRRVLLERRPVAGVWGGLWSFPECPIDTDAADWVERSMDVTAEVVECSEPFTHVFSHFRLQVHPTVLRVTGHDAGYRCQEQSVVAEPDAAATRRWMPLPVRETVGLAAPVRRLVDILDTTYGSRSKRRVKNKAKEQ